MVRRLDTATFVERANKVHNGKYDYAKTVYKNMKDKVIITCPIHGDFEQAPGNHLAGKGCPDCNPSKRNTQASFIAKARAVHGDKYDYSKVVFTRNKDKVIIICPKHGEFLQEANSHLQGFGCPECNNEQRSERFSMDTIRKAQATVKDRYGVANVMELDSVKKKVSDTVQKRYGVDNALKLPETRKKAVDAIVQKYGVKSAFGAKVVRDKASRTMKLRYGVSEAMSNADFVEKMKRSTIKNDTKRKHGTFSTSKPEQELYELLVAYFGNNDVETQYRDEVRYPFNADFYIPSRDMFIELNAHWTHGEHWYGAKDQSLVDDWTNRGSKCYDLAVDTFSRRDVLKRRTAANSRLNYVVFWDPKLVDAQMWFASGSPDSKDYIREYEWLPDRNLTVTTHSYKKMTPHAMSQLVKQYQFDVFYRHELDLWRNNGYTKKRVLLQAQLYMNRFHYLGMTPAQITDKQLLSGFAVSGLWRGYSEFDASLMAQAIDEFKPTRIYDPFSGWGERGFMAASKQIPYFGVDINRALMTGYRQMISDNNLHGITYKVADSQNIACPSDVDMVVTCPPYFNTEMYTNVGIENDSYDDFLKAFDVVVNQCRYVKHFCFQINQKYKSDMQQIVEANGFHLIKSYKYTTNKSSHFQRGVNGVSLKREFEEMLVFERN